MPVENRHHQIFFLKGGLMFCRHCQQAPISRPRKLCWSCYYTPGVRDLYPTTSKFGRRGVANFYGRAPLPAFPTQALPGSPEKVALLIQRAQQRQELFHPDDATCDGALLLCQAG
jgi:hypothetical protein